MGSKVLERAREIFHRDNPGHGNTCPFGGNPYLEQLWPADQEKYIERAERELFSQANSV